MFFCMPFQLSLKFICLSCVKEVCRKQDVIFFRCKDDEFIFNMMASIRFFSFFCILLASSFFGGCGGIQVHRGSFEARTPDTYIGPALAVKNDSNVRKVNISLRIPNNKHVHLNGIENDPVQGYEYSLGSAPADIYYDLKMFPVAASFDYFTKKRFMLGGIGFGFNPYPYFRLTGGVNLSYFEMGAFSSLGLALVSYSVYAPYIDDQGNLAGAGTSTKGIVDCNDCIDVRFNGNFGFYINVFPFRDFTLSYSLSAFNPWLFKDLDGYPLAFYLPFIFSHYFGAGYTFASRYQVSLGANVHWGNHFNEKIWNLESKVSLIF